MIDIYFPNGYLEHKFHIVPEEVNLPCEGILGKDFIKDNNCIINYKTNTIEFDLNDEKIVLDLLQGPNFNTLYIPARCETIKRINIINSTEPQVIESQQLENDIFIARCVVDPTHPYIRILNISNKPKLIGSISVKSDNLSNYHVYTIDETKNTDERTDELINLLQKSTPNDFRNEIGDLCKEFTDIFSLESDKMTINNFYEQKLRLNDNTPVYIKNYRLPQTQKEEIDKQVTKLINNDLIEPSQSAYNSPIILVPKKSTNNEKKWRMCIDYRMLNRKLIPDKFPLPRIDEILDQLGRTKYFSILDLYSGFHQIPIEHNSREITAFSTANGTYQWKVLPFGLNIAPNSFMRMMNLAFSGLEPHKAFIYMDDIIIIGCSIKHHLSNLKSVFHICRQHNLKLNPMKCQFFKSEVTFLGHLCTADGILPDQKKLHAVENYPIPNDKHAVKRFTAFANYYRKFIKDFAKIACPLNNLTRKNTEFIWSQECDTAFHHLREKLMTAPILQYPDFNKDFMITVDASDVACGGVLSQNINGNDLPLYYISKSFKKGEKNKPTIEKELIAIHYAITTFRPYVYGRKFLVRSDHKPLTHLYKRKNPASKLTNIRLDLEEYDFVIEHISGKNNVVADALSRISINELKEKYKSNENNIMAITTRSMTRKNEIKINENENKSTNNENKMKIYEEIGSSYDKKVPRIRMTDKNELSAYKSKKLLFKIKLANSNNTKLISERIINNLENLSKIHKATKFQIPINDQLFSHVSINEFKEICDRKLKNIEIILISEPKSITCNDEQLKLIEKYHNDPVLGGHCGSKRLYTKLRRYFYWKKMIDDITEYTKTCQKCQLNKIKARIKEPMKITKTPQRAFDIIIVDTIGPLQKSIYENVYAVTLMCDLTKYLITIPIQNKEARTVARAIFNNFILVYGPVLEMRTDLGTEYKNEIMTELCQMLNINHQTSTAYHHETVGTIERSHRTLNEYLRSYLNTNRDDWEEYLKYFTYCYNTTPNTCFNCKFTPYELVLSKKPIIPEILNKNTIDPIYNIENFAKEAKYRLQMAQKEAIKYLDKSKIKNKNYYDKNTNKINLKINDMVLITNENRHKLDSLYSGPFQITKIDDVNVEIIDLKTGKIQTIHKNRLKLYFEKK